MAGLARVALGSLLIGATALPAGAVAPPGRGVPHARHEPDLVLADDAAPRGTPRARSRIEHGPGAPGTARATRWARFEAARGAGWQASWDRATAVPSRIWGPGIATPGVMASAAAAEAAARAALAAHLELLAPGAALADFELVANIARGGVRSVGFVQHHAGLRVVGGQVSFRFKADRLVVMSSQAAPDVTIALPRTRRAAAGLRADVARAMTTTLGLATPPRVTAAAGADVILPIVGDDAVLTYRVVREHAVDAGAEGEFVAWVDPATGAVVARRALRQHATGTLRLDAVDRHPGRDRTVVPAALMRVTTGATTSTTGADGTVTWSPDATTPIAPTALGPEVEVVDVLGTAAVGALTLSPGGSVTWSEAADALRDGQLQAFVHTSIVRNYIRRFAADLPALAEPLLANVNIADECNAYFDGESINFFQASGDCQNSALLADVIYHEVGHWLHRNALIDGVGAFDGAMSEGLSDFLAASITGDSGMGRGFFYGDAPLREIDPEDGGPVWPDDVGEIHKTGIIYGAIFWDLRGALIDALGEAEGRATVERLFYGSVQRATDIPSSLIEVLLEDDDDGDLANGTPNECAIRFAFGAHGLRTAYGFLTAPGHVANTDAAAAAPVKVEVRGASAACPGEAVTGVELRWQPGFGSTPERGERAATQVSTAAGEHWEVMLPLPSPRGRVDYQAWIRFADGGEAAFPDNPADAWYQLSAGPMVPLYCTGFDDDPFADHWTQGGDGAPWAWAGGLGGAHDPAAPFTGEAFLAMGAGASYTADALSWAQLPRIDVGAYSDVHLQYRRWLTVEDAYFDQAQVLVNGEPAWTNFDSDDGDASNTHHVDKEWRYIDLGLSTKFAGPLLDVRFSLLSDGGLEFGGWNVDDLCVVANPTSICGDGVRAPTEECDDGAGNGEAPDACRATCKRDACGDGIVDSDEACDPGSPTATCDADCNLIGGDDTGGCAAGGGAPGGALLAALAALGLGRRRRHRSAGSAR